jgi:hypothetical protein
MPIVSSAILTDTLQVDGSKSVLERHTDHQGKSYDIQYFAGPDMDIQQVLAERASRLGAEIDARLAAEAEANSFELPLTKKQFLDRFTASEYAAVRAAAAQNATLDFYWQKLMVAESVYLSNAETQAGVQMLEAAGLIAAGRATEILEG